MPTLRELNQAFCKGAEKFIYIHRINGHDVFTEKIPRLFDPAVQGVLRTIKNKAPGEYLLIMDIDGEPSIGLTEEMLSAGRIVWNLFAEDEKPFEKDSGVKGLQLGWKVVFPKPLEESESVECLERMAIAIYEEAKLEELGIGFGKGLDPPYVDTSMFECGRKVRGFCTRFNGNFSVPLTVDDNLLTASLKRKLQMPLTPLQINTLIYDDGKFGSVSHRGKYQTMSLVDPTMVGVIDDNISRRFREIYLSLGNYLRSVVVYKGDIAHFRKRHLVWYLMRMGMSDIDIINFVLGTCKWSDLNSEEITTKQVLSLRKTYEKVCSESGQMRFPSYVMS